MKPKDLLDLLTGNRNEQTIMTTEEYYHIVYGIPKKEKELPKIKNVIYHKPATIIYWEDDTKTVVKCGENDIYDAEKGLAMGISKKAMGNKGNYNKIFKKWIPNSQIK